MKRLHRPLGFLAACFISAGAFLVVGSMTSANHPAPSAAQTKSGNFGVDALPGSSGSVPPSSGTLPDGSQGPDPGIIATLSIPRIGITNAPILDRGPDGKGGMLIAPGYGVTHFHQSAPIGRGNAVLYGHDDIEGSVFARLGQLQPGDLITVTQIGGTQTYRVVDRKIVLPTAIEILAPTADVRLTLFTCWPNNVDNKRVVLIATLGAATSHAG